MPTSIAELEAVIGTFERRFDEPLSEAEKQHIQRRFYSKESQGEPGDVSWEWAVRPYAHRKRVLPSA